MKEGDVSREILHEVWEWDVNGLGKTQSLQV